MSSKTAFRCLRRVAGSSRSPDLPQLPASTGRAQIAGSCGFQSSFAFHHAGEFSIEKLLAEMAQIFAFAPKSPLDELFVGCRLVD
jgi:hypothetical protein